MKTFKEILDQVYGQSELAETETTFADYAGEKILTIQLAHAEIWGEADYSFRDRTSTFVTVAAQSAYDMPNGKIKKAGLKASTATRPMTETTNVDSLPVSSGLPYYYFLENQKLNLYPTPDAAYTITTKTFTNNKAKSSGGTEQDTLVLETDVLNIPADIESLYLAALGYKTIILRIADVNDELYQHALNNYSIALKLLKIESSKSSTAPRFT